MKKIIHECFLTLLFVFAIMTLNATNVYAETTETTETSETPQYTITIDPNGGIEGSEFKSTIVLSEEETYAVNGSNEDFLKAPEGKKFSGIEIINKDGEVEGIATAVLLWGYDYFDNMTLKFYWGDIISDIDLDMEYPSVGDSTTTPMDDYGYYDDYEQTNKPEITADSEYGYEVQFTEWVDKDSFNEEYEYYEKPYIGTFESGKTYYALVDLYNNSTDYAFNDIDSLNITLNGKDASVYRVVGESTFLSITFAITLEDNTYKVIEGANQKVDSNSDAEFEINADYSLFENGGKVYVDDNLLDQSNYTSRRGSTIITLKKDYINTLSEGLHTLKVEFKDSNIATTTFTVTKSSNRIMPPKTGTTNNTLFYIIMILLNVTYLVTKRIK